MTRRQFFAAFVAALVGAVGTRKLAKPGIARVAGDGQTGSTLMCGGISEMFAPGDVITIEGMNAQSGNPLLFVVTESIAPSQVRMRGLPIYPAITPPSSPYANCFASPKNGAAIRRWTPGMERGYWGPGTASASAYREDGHSFYRFDYTDRVWLPA